ncbi:MAG: dTMP kinase [Armatimonadetes bacterium]|nr:dTMP kinase [Armatimonadota bacterium]
MSGRFVTLEGPEGAGKSTLAAALAKRLPNVLLTREPGDGPVGRKIREALLHGDELDSWTEVFLFLADRRQHVEGVIRPALDQGKTVICDRYADSTVVYQGHGRDLPVDLLRKLNRLATSGLTPDLTILLDLPAEAGLSRLADKDRMDREPLSFHERVREGFLMEAKRDPDRWRVLDASLPADELADRAAGLI